MTREGDIAPVQPTTDWRAVAAIVAAGVVSAYHLGKVPIAAMQLQAGLGLSLGMLGALGATFALLGAVGGVLAGTVVARMDDRRMLVAGLAATVLGTAVALAQQGSFAMLLASRVVEGLGFLLITVSGPAVIARVVLLRDRNRAMALWSCFMPGGIALAMLTGPWLGGWRWLWVAAALASGVIAALVCWRVPAAGRAGASTSAGTGDAAPLRSRLSDVLRSEPLALAATFALYSLMFFALFSFLPVLLQERMHASPAAVGLLTAIASAANIAGNLAAGVWLKKVGRAVLVRTAAAAMAVCALGIFLPGLDPVASFGLCLLFSAAGGLVPSSLLASVPQVTATPAHATLAVGLLMQGSNLGQALGPVLVGTVVDRHGWPAAAAWVVAAALLMAWVVRWREGGAIQQRTR